MKVKVQHKFV